MSISQNYPTIEPSLNLSFALTKKLDPRITFSRPTTGVAYDGKTVAKAEENLLLRSQEFDNASWVKSGATVTANTEIAPDGTTTADSFIPLATNAAHRVQQTTTGTGAWAFSVFVKANGYSKIAIWDYATTGAYAAFDLSTGTVLDSGVGASSATITALTNSWYRISFVATVSGTVGFAVQVLDPAYTTGPVNNAWLADGTSGIFIWGAQLEQRSAVTAYTPTTTQPITNYIPALQTASANVARFDHNPTTGESLGLLVEEQRTNLVTYSEDFGNAAWTKARVTVTPNTLVAPDGTLTADKLVETTDTNTHFVNENATVTSGATYTFSVYLKKAERRFVSLSDALVTARTTTFDLELGTVVTQNASIINSVIESVGNGWFRCGITFAATSTTIGARVGLMDATGTVTPSYTGDGYSGIYIWGAQLESSSFSTSYIKTVASQVTRSADSASDSTIEDWYRADQGTFYVEASTSSASTLALNIHDGSSSNQMQFLYGPSGVSFLVLTNGVTQANFGQRVPLGKLAATYEFNNFAVSTNGVSASTDTSGIIPVVNQLRIGSRFDGSFNLNGTIKKISYYPARLTNEQLQSLTS
jgi:hypothetical protein